MYSDKGNLSLSSKPLLAATIFSRLLIGITVLFQLSVSHASTPLWTFTPLTETTVSVPANGSMLIQYRVTNQSIIPQTLRMKAIKGISQITTKGNCSHTFKLSSHKSCNLALQVNGSLLKGNVVGGPTVCNTWELFPLCLHPKKADRLNITQTSAEIVSLSVSPASLILTLDDPSQSLKITNNSSTVTATNLVANLTGTALASNVTQDASNCTFVLPGQTCVLTFTRGDIAVSSTNFPIQGDNTSQVGASIAIVLPTQAPIDVSGSPLVLQGTTGTPLPGKLTITNNAPILTATNIAAVLTGTALEGSIIQDATDCENVVHGASCTLIFTPGSVAVPATSVVISGDNTSVSTATIAVNKAPQASIAITGGSPLTLSPNDSGTMTIQNNSATEVASNIVANFTSTPLNGFVTQDGSSCTHVEPGATCTLTFTAGATAISQASFHIQGDNTIAVTGEIGIAVAIGDSYQGGKVGCLTSEGGIANLVAATVDNRANIIWGTAGHNTGATSDFDGAKNTTTIVNRTNETTPNAATTCDSYAVDSAGNTPCQAGTCYNDWFLPARTQLQCLYINQKAIGDFANSMYWSSTEITPYFAFNQDFTNGDLHVDFKFNNHPIRCVRSFTL